MLSLLQLFDLLGFDCFELIQSLLENRQSLVEATYKSATDVIMAKHLSELYTMFERMYKH